MAAGVVTSSVASRKDLPDGQEGLIPYYGSVEVATTSIDDVGDDVLLYLFPPVCYLPLMAGLSGLAVFSDDLDTGSPALVMDFGIGDSDGVIDTVLINDSSVGQAGGRDDLDAQTADNMWTSVGGKYLIMTVVTAATTAAAGTISFAGVYSRSAVKLV